jgi:uncharacterized protein YdaU (DUF1376 family)
MLLASSWDAEPVATLPADDDKVRRLAGASPEEWSPIRDEVMANFEPYEGGRLVNVRLRQQYEEMLAFAESSSARGKAGAAARWQKPSNAQALPEHNSSNAQPMTNDSSATASSTSINNNNFNGGGAKEKLDGGRKTYLTIRKQIIDAYPMKPFTPVIADKWRLAIDVEVETIRETRRLGTPEEAASWLLGKVEAYAGTKQAKPYTLQNFLHDGHYQRDWAPKVPTLVEPTANPRLSVEEPDDPNFSVEEAELLKDHFKVTAVDDPDGLV